MDDHRTLPGLFRKSLVARVRTALGRYGIRPCRGNQADHLNQIWRDGWQWAYAKTTRALARFLLIAARRLLFLHPRITWAWRHRNGKRPAATASTRRSARHAIDCCRTDQSRNLLPESPI